MEKTFKIGALCFKSRRKAFDYARNKIHSYKLGIYPRQTDEYAFLSDLSGKKPDMFILEQNQGNKSGVHMAYVERNKRYETSWKNYALFRFDPNPEKNLKRAMRNSIHYQLPKIPHNSRCKKCDAKRDLTIDHIKPFKVLIEEFKQMLAQKHPNIKTPVTFSRNKTHSKIFSPQDTIYKHLWQEFHYLNAKYDILCNRCNSIKGTEVIFYHYRKTYRPPPLK